jgi:signal transduction histidine kinase
VRLGSGLPLAVGDTDLAAICGEAIDEIDAERGFTDLIMQGDLRGRWDRDRLAQLASNLIGNACQHRARGSRVRVLLDGAGADEVRLVVQNRGAIDPALAAEIFEPLRGGRRGRGSSGLGLGLFISRAIVVAHRGTIRAESDGATVSFVVTLPRAT